MRAGKLDEQIVIQSRSDSQNASGQVTPSWATFDTVWAEPLPAQGREFFGGEARRGELVMAFRIRYLGTVTGLMRISWNGRFWGIHSVVEERGFGRHRNEMIYCSSVTGGQGDGG